MMCTKCRNVLHECTCDDLEERLEKLADIDHFQTDRCANCHRNRPQCTCDEYEPL